MNLILKNSISLGLQAEGYANLPWIWGTALVYVSQAQSFWNVSAWKWLSCCWVFGFYFRIAIACLIDYFPELFYSCSRKFPRALSLASLNLTQENLIQKHQLKHNFSEYIYLTPSVHFHRSCEMQIGIAFMGTILKYEFENMARGFEEVSLCWWTPLRIQVPDSLGVNSLWACGVHNQTNSGGNVIAGKGTRTFWATILMDLFKATLEFFPFHGAQASNIWDDR